MSRYLAEGISARLSLWKRKRERKQRVKREKLVQARTDLLAWQQRRAEVFRRDHGRCRATGVKLMLMSENPFMVAHCHHIVYRSAGGKDDMPNLLTLSVEAHEAEHAGLLHIEVGPHGGDGMVTFTSRDTKGSIVKVWESPCPQ
jgi:hypothetical protein